MTVQKLEMYGRCPLRDFRTDSSPVEWRNIFWRLARYLGNVFFLTLEKIKSALVKKLFHHRSIEV